MEKKNFMGGMNVDDSDRIIPQNDYRFALNVSNSIKEDSDFGEITNIKGARKVINENFTNNANAQVIGSWEDVLDKKVYYFVHNILITPPFNISKKHAIFYYDINTDEIVLVLESSFLNFNKAHMIYHVGKIDKYLFWTDGVNPPRKLDVEKAINGDYDNYTDDYFLEVYSKPPMLVINAESKTNSQQKTNNVKGKLWQFKYRWIYYDDTKSTFSPISKIYAPANQYSGSFIADVPYWFDNYYELTYNTGDIEVMYVEISAREGNDGDFYSVVQIDVDGKVNVEETFDFYNDNQSLPIPRVESNQLYSFVPLVASSQEVVQPNRILYGNYVEGYDNIDINAFVRLSQGDDPNVATDGLSCYGYGIRGIDVFNSWQFTPGPGGGGKGPIQYLTVPGGSDSNYSFDGPPQPYSRDDGYRYSDTRGFLVDLNQQYFNSNSAFDKPFREVENSLRGAGNAKHNIVYEAHAFCFQLDDFRNNRGYEDYVYFTSFQFQICHHENYDDTDKSQCDGGGVYGWGTLQLFNEEKQEPFRFDISIATKFEDNDFLTLLDRARIIKNKIRDQIIAKYDFLFEKFSESGDKVVFTFRRDYKGTDCSIYYGNGSDYTRNTSRSGCGGSWNNSYRNFNIILDIEFTRDDDDGSITKARVVVRLDGARGASSESPTGGIGDWFNWYGNNTFQQETAQNTLWNYKYPQTFNYANYVNVTAYRLKGDYATNNKFKRASRHQLGFVYYDEAGRSSLVQTDENLNFYCPSQNEQVRDVEVALEIYHNPPSWAETWQVVYSGNLHYQKFIYSNIAEFETNGELWSCVLIPLQRYQEDSGSILTYEWTEGDIIRFISPAYDIGDSQPFYDDVYQSLITSGEDWVDPDDDNVTGYKIYFKPISGFPTTEPKDGEVLPLVELYTPKQKILTNDGENLSANIFYEVGLTYPVVNGKHLPNNEILLPLNSTGDIYRRLRQDNDSGMIGYVEDMNYTDFKRNPYWDKGRPNISDPSFRQVRRTNALIYSGVFTTNSTINETNIFREANFIEYETIYGGIQKLFYNDGRLLIFMNNKVGQALINKDVLFDSSGGAVGSVGQAEQVVGNINYYVGDYGIGDYAESFSAFGTTRFFFDSYHTSPMILFSNGLEPIDGKLNTYFTKKTNELIYTDTTRNYSVKSAYNRDTGEFFMVYFYKSYNDIFFINVKGVRPDLRLNGNVVKPTLKDVPIIDIEQTTLSFSDVKKRWTSFYSVEPEWVESCNNDIISFKDGQLYIHDSQERNKQYNTTIAPSEIDVIFNAESDNTKVFKNFGVKASKLWLSEISTTPEGQQTSNIESDYREREGEFYAHLMRDENSPGGIIEGDSMRSYSLRTKFKNVSSELVRLWSVSVEFFASRFTK